VTQETQQTQQSVSDMVRITANNTINFFNEIANHIDQLENRIRVLEAQIEQYEKLSVAEFDDHK